MGSLDAEPEMVILVHMYYCERALGLGERVCLDRETAKRAQSHFGAGVIPGGWLDLKSFSHWSELHSMVEGTHNLFEKEIL